MEGLKKHIEQENQTAAELIKWTETFNNQFDLGEKWVQDGLEKLGIELENFQKAYDQLQMLSMTPDYNDGLVIASTTLKSIHDLLKGGIPVVGDTLPTQINGLERVETSGNQKNCLIHALLKVSNPKRDMESIEKQAKEIREALILEMNKRLDSAFENKEFQAEEMQALLTRANAVVEQDDLDLADHDGQTLIKYLREQKKIDPDRSLLVYELDKQRKLRCSEHYPVSSRGKKPYSLFLYQDYHFEAMIEPQMDK